MSHVHPTSSAAPESTYDDAHAVHLILALIHDCFIGFVISPPSHHALISLSITSPDLKLFQGLTPTRLKVLHQLVGLRDGILNFPGAHLSEPFFGGCIERVCAEPVKDWVEEGEVCATLTSSSTGDSEWINAVNILSRIHGYLLRLAGGMQAPEMSQVVEVCNDIRQALGVRLWFLDPDHEKQTLRPVEREVALLYDIMNAFYVYVERPGYGPGRASGNATWTKRPFISLDITGKGHGNSDKQTRRLVLVRDVLCGLLDGPSILRWEGAWETYLLPALKERQLWMLAQMPMARALLQSLDALEACFAVGGKHSFSVERLLRCLRTLTNTREGGFAEWLPDLYPEKLGPSRTITKPSDSEQGKASGVVELNGFWTPDQGRYPTKKGNGLQRERPILIPSGYYN